MNSLQAARKALADAVTGAGMPCLTYPPDNPMPPVAFVDSMTLDYSVPASLTMPQQVVATIVSCAQRHDKPGSTARLEDLIAPVVAALQGIQGVLLTTVDSGQTELGTDHVPAVIYTVRFALAE